MRLHAGKSRAKRLIRVKSSIFLWCACVHFYIYVYIHFLPPVAPSHPPSRPRARLLHSNMAESVSTLRYAGRAMNIKNTAVKNEDVSGPPVSFAEVGRPSTQTDEKVKETKNNNLEQRQVH